MPMTVDELDEVWAEIEGYFPTVSARLNRAPKLLALWRRTLQPFPAPLVLDAVERAAAKNSRTLELNDLVRWINKLLEERQRSMAYRSERPPGRSLRATVNSILAQTARMARTPEDRLIAKLHCETVYRGLNLPDPTVRQQAAAQWRQWAKTYPAIRNHCLEQAETCFEFANGEPEVACRLKNAT